MKEEEEEAAVAKLGRRNEKQGQRGLGWGASLFGRATSLCLQNILILHNFVIECSVVGATD